MLFAIVAVNETATQGIILYAVAYSVATIGIFAILLKLKDYTFEGYNGLARKHPLLALVNTIFLLSLAGIPLTAGFFAKYFVLSAAIQQGQLLWLVIPGGVMCSCERLLLLPCDHSDVFQNRRSGNIRAYHHRLQKCAGDRCCGDHPAGHIPEPGAPIPVIQYSTI